MYKKTFTYDAGTRITKYFQSYILQINRQIASCNICKILDIFNHTYYKLTDKLQVVIFVKFWIFLCEI